MNSILSILVAVTLSQFVFSQAWADEDANRFNRISFAETVTETVNNDQVTVHFLARAQDDDPDTVAREINQQMQQAKRLLDRTSGLRIQTGGYQIHPIYDKNRKIQSWRGQQSLSIETQNTPGLAEILADLQSLLNYNGMQFSVSRQQKERVMSQLLKRGIQAYRDTAKQIARAFGKEAFNITETRIENTMPPGLYRQPRALAMTAMKAESAPVMEAGESDIRLTITGVVTIRNDTF
ncbi:hypothetical protein AVO42_03575 [Thiomicrospira sp. XS5]|uniref:SIMPL domain-containing protein n=1 Tax=Thiomicrospira sp. XS5 TaxID=1775636 RepID=UPI00074713A1|nr:SIMPL domain-containing protein [Thiomicrospira sp. XS5]KUJ74491.1 hypothetical protein AVO42_03575 [Thiomicrospira sp. XS5]